MPELRCINCGRKHRPDERIYTCPACNGLLEVTIDLDKISVNKSDIENRKPGVWRYREFLPVKEGSKIITLEEGGTPLYRAKNLEKELGIKELYIKNEGANPSGSFKDRGMTVGVSKAIELGATSVGCASTGNTSASLAAYAGKAGIKCIVLLPAGKIAIGKLAQAVLHGALVVGIRGNFDIALKLIREAGEKLNIYLLNSINPWRLEGQKTQGYEILDQMSWEVPDRIIVPVGNCGNISSIWKGLKEFREYGFCDTLPIMTGIQAEGAAPVVHAFENRREDITPIGDPDTLATAIRIGAPVNAPKALTALKESKGLAKAVTDEEIISAQKLIARKEGIGVEPASASSIAGLIKLLDNGTIQRDERIVCITTGHALKDPEAIFNNYEKPVEIDPDINVLKDLLRS